MYTVFRSPRLVRGAVASLLLLVIACGDDDPSSPAVERPTLVELSATANVLSTRAIISASGLDSVRVRYSEPSDGEATTPAVAVTGDTVSVLVAGLRAEATYELNVEGWRRGTLLVGNSQGFTTASLPTPLQSMTLDITSGTPSGGFTMVPVLIGQNGYLVAFDSAATIRWYFDGTPYRPGSAPADHEQLENGNIVVYLGATRGYDAVPGYYVEVTLGGEIVRTYAAPPPLYTDNHDIIVEFEDGEPVAANFFSYDIRLTDLTPVGGNPGTLVAGHQILRQPVDGSAGFFWNAWDHFSLFDWIEEPQSLKLAPTADFDHPNSIDMDAAGNYVVSWRHFGEVSKIDGKTGAVLWRWGGRNNEFTFVDDAFGLFSGQHSVRILPNNRYLIYDNGLRHAPPETRVVEYQLDEVAKTATLVWEYRHAPALYTPYVGSVARLTNGNTFIGWGGAGTVQEVTNAKVTVWEAVVRVNGATSFFYRARRVPDLYRFQVP